MTLGTVWIDGWPYYVTTSDDAPPRSRALPPGSPPVEAAAGVPNAR